MLLEVQYVQCLSSIQVYFPSAQCLGPCSRRQGEFDPEIREVWVHNVQAWRLCHRKAAASHETWTTVMEITGSADETEMTKNTKDAAHEHAAASINCNDWKKKLEMTKTSFTGCKFAIKCTTHLCQSNHVTSKNKHTGYHWWLNDHHGLCWNI